MIVYSITFTDADSGDLTVEFKPTQAEAKQFKSDLQTCAGHHTGWVEADLEKPIEIKQVDVPSTGREALCEFLNQQFSWSFRNSYQS